MGIVSDTSGAVTNGVASTWTRYHDDVTGEYTRVEWDIGAGVTGDAVVTPASGPPVEFRRNGPDVGGQNLPAGYPVATTGYRVKFYPTPTPPPAPLP